MQARLRQLIQDDAAQDLIEYSLIATFIALSAVAMIMNVGTGVNTMYATSDTQVQAAVAAAS